jgi:DNA-binding GntR family transcriptional regulator
MTTPAKSRSNASIAVDRLRALIFSGDLSPGSDHLESELAEALGMSRTPVREAVVMLASQGLLQSRPRKGVRILPVSPTDMAEIYDVLTELESLAAKDAATRTHSAADLATITKAIDDMDTALTSDDREAWAQADDTFHSELMRLGGNARAAAIVAMLADQVRRARMVTLYMRPAPTSSNADHRDVLEAIRSGNADKAHSLHHAHRTQTKTTLLSLLNAHHLKSL